MARRKDEEGERTDKMQQVEDSAARPFGGKPLNGTATSRRDDSVEQSLDDFVRQAAGPATDDLDAAPEASQPSLVVEAPRVDSSLSHLSSQPAASASQPRITTAPQSAPGISYGILFGAIAAAGVLAAVIAVVVVKLSAREPAVPTPAAKVEATPVARPAEPVKPAVEQLPPAAPAQAAPAPAVAPVKAEPIKAAAAAPPEKAPVARAAEPRHAKAPTKPAHAVKARPAAAPVRKAAPGAKAAPAKKNELADPGF